VEEAGTSTHEGELKFESRVGVLNDDGSERLTNSMLHSFVVVIVGEVVGIEVGGSLPTSGGKSELGSLVVSNWKQRTTRGRKANEFESRETGVWEGIVSTHCSRPALRQRFRGRKVEQVSCCPR